MSFYGGTTRGEQITLTDFATKMKNGLPQEAASWVQLEIREQW